MMRKKILNILKYIVICSIFCCFFPLLIFADMNAYATLTDCQFIDMGNGKSKVITINKSNFDGRAVLFHNVQAGSWTWAIVWTSSFKASLSSQTASPACATSFNRSTSSYVYKDSVTYYICKETVNNITDGSNGTMFANIVPAIIENTSDKTAYNNNELIIDYTYGNAVVPEPAPPINWGLVRDPEYSTRIAGNGYAAKRNIDYLSWNNEVDSNGNDISECSINIKAVLGSWSGTTEEDLLNKTYNDFNIGNYSAIDLGSVPASSGLFSVSWQRIIDEAGWNFDSIYSHLEDNLFLKQGWYYQLQLVDPDGGVHQWQTLYTPLSSSAAASETVINHNSFDTSIYQVYQDLATINNNTSITINIQDTDYTVTNPDDGDEPSGGVDLWDILKQMLNGIFQIVKNIAALPGKFLEMIQQLITPPQQISEEINTNFNNNMQDLNESQPGLMESMNAVEDIQDTLNQSVNSFNGVPECIFTWDAVTMDLSAFNAGTVTFIAAGSFDFAASFMQMINGFGMTYSEYQFYVSAIIYAWILVFIYRHVYDFLAGTKES